MDLQEIWADPLNFTGVFHALAYHWYWMLFSGGLGVWAGWRVAAESETPKDAP